MSYSNRCTIATLPRTTRGMPLVLGGDPKGKTFLYTNGNSVIIRDIANNMISDIYTEHSVACTVAKYSPSGFYIASADQSGKVRIWDTINKEHILKAEYQPFVGPIKDLAWSSDNQRIVVVGEGRERMGHVFSADTGTSVGEISGHSNLINSCDFRPKRPFRIITGSEDNSTGIFQGPPFKFVTTLTDHTRYVQSVRFSPDGDLFASAGFDGKMFLYKCDDYSKVGEFGDGSAHNGGIYAISWSPDGKKIVSASGDKTCKIFDVSTLKVISEFNMGSDIVDQQVSCLWQGNNILSVSLSGFINYLDENDSSKPSRVIKGHNKSITALTITEDKTIYTASHDSAVMYWDLKSGEHDRISGIGHTNTLQSLEVNSDKIYTCSLDDSSKIISLAEKSYLPDTIKFDSQPREVAVSKSCVLVACVNELCVIEDKKITFKFPIDFDATSIAVHPTESDVAVGGGKDMKVHVFLFAGNSFSSKNSMSHSGSITAVLYSPNGAYLAASDSNRKIVLYDTFTYEPSHKFDWCFHTARVNCLAFCPNSLYLASGSLDTNIIIWSVKQPSKHLIIKRAHPQSQITKVHWLDEQTLISTGQDSNIKVFDISFSV